MANGKKTTVELSEVRIQQLFLSLAESGEWQAQAHYWLSDVGGTVGRGGVVTLPVDGKATVEDVWAAVVLEIEDKEGLE